MESLAELTDEDHEHIRSVVEPQLFKLGYLQRLKGGRTITQEGITFLKDNGHISDLDTESAVYSMVG